MLAAVLAISWQWTKEMAKNAMLWVMVALPTGIAWAVMHTGTGGAQPFAALWLVFAQLMTGLMLSSGHWLEEREQGTWQALRVSPVPVGWLLAAQAALISVVTFLSELLVFWVNHGASPWSGPLASYTVLGAVTATAIGVLIGVLSPSARAGSMLATVVMLVLFLGAITAPGLAGFPLLKDALRWLPSVLTLTALNAGLAGSYPPASTTAVLGLWLLLALACVHLALRREYRDGR